MEHKDFNGTNYNLVHEDGNGIVARRVWRGFAGKGSCDGQYIEVIAHKPSEEDLKVLNDGGLIFLTVLGKLPSLLLSTNFTDASDPK